jgi:hypothetical protein
VRVSNGVSANLTEYLEEMAAENARQSIANPGDRRLAVNAIMTLDGFWMIVSAIALDILK